jgi:pyruvate dehydrogenase E2 component (dihydrolipoamide acetyltransferase)
MAEIINMPKLGFDMAEGTLVRWVKAEGDTIEHGDVLAEIETDKATVEVESQASGVVHKHLVEEGTPVPVGKPIAVIGEKDEKIDIEALVGAEGNGTAVKPETSQGETTQAPSPAASQAESVPAESRAAQTQADGHLPGGVKASPVARRMAAEKNLDLTAVSGSGPGGRIVKSDVESAAAGGGAPSGPAFGAKPLAPGQTERVPLTRLRSAIGRRMSTSKQQVPHFYVTADLNAGPLMALRAEMNAALPETSKISVNDFIVRAAALSLRQFPNLNASLEEDVIVRHGEVRIGMAVAVEDGLLTVVLRNADQKSLPQIAEEAKPLFERARDGRVRPEDIEGSTFTVSNLGMFDVDNFIAIINPPEAAILAVGSVRKVPVVAGEGLAIGQRLKVTLAADHRVTDGAEAAQWLQDFRTFIEHPVRLLI